MKQYSVFLVAIFALILCSCAPQIDPPFSDKATSTTETMARVTLPNLLPPPEAIKLMDMPYFYESVELMKYRVIYYRIHGEFDSLAVYDGTRTEQLVKEDEMLLVSYAKHYNIGKKIFVEAVRQRYENSIITGWEDDIYAESAELPNADIIYTFDNEIINAYYRRENPVEPDWTKVKTYETYAAYLAENPE
ncbi:MAG: hypothetical protein FWH55_14480 [Oscillospiraceae bacterium]|nr:hypothetical protein [Oscillospiraceae bacterium]